MDKKYTILCVDDEESILNTIKRTLRTDYNVLTALSGQEGLEILKDNKVDLVISDQRMPTMSGFEFLRQVKEMYPSTIRMMLSGYSDFESLIKTVNEGEIIHYISKPWDNDQLKEILRSTLEKNYVIHQANDIINNIKKISGNNKSLDITTEKNTNTVTLRISSKDPIANEGNIYKFIELLFEAFDMQHDAKIDIFNNIVSKEGGELTFNLELGQGVNLNIKIPSV